MSVKKDLIQNTGIPHWMQPPKKTATDGYYEWTWEAALVRVRAGETMTSICRDPTMPAHRDFVSWIHADAARKDAYYAARAIGAEKVEDEILDISDGTMEGGMPSDVKRDSLRIETRKFLLGVWDRTRYKPPPTVDVSVTVDLTEAMERANERAGTVIEGEVIRK